MVQVEGISCYARIIRQRKANMIEDIFKVTHIPGGWRNDLEIEVEIRKGTLYPLRRKKENIGTIVKKLADEDWKLE